MLAFLQLFLLLLYCSSIAAQSADRKGRYVDLHPHPLMKNYYRYIKNPDNVSLLHSNDTTNWRTFQSKVKPGKFNNVRSVDQATYRVLHRSGASILCASLYTLEKQSISDTTFPITGVIRNETWRNTIRFTPLRLLDHLISLRCINRVAVTGISKRRQKTAYDRSVSNFEELAAQLRFLDLQAEYYHSYRPVRLARTNLDLYDTSKIWLALSIEGAHNFYGPSISDPNDIRRYTINSFQENEMLANLDQVKNNYRLFFVTPAHLFENKVAGGARGLDIDKSIFRRILARLMWDKRFAMIDNKDIEGINHIFYTNAKFTDSLCKCTYDSNIAPDTVSIGWNFINRLLAPNNEGKRTFVDMRHMDVKARWETIQHIKGMNSSLPQDQKIPLIVSHAAVSGKKRSTAWVLGLCPQSDDYEEFMPGRIRAFYQDIAKHCPDSMGMGPAGVDDHLNIAGWFHPMSNNLFDEEIQEVYASSGIIGITMEERVLGWKGYNYIINEQTIDSLSDYFDAHYRGGLTGKRRAKLKKDLLIAEPFVRNLFYIVEHSGLLAEDTANGSMKSWAHVAIGSDFDGIMNPIDICPRASDIPAFYQFLCNNLTFYATYLGKKHLMLGRSPVDLMDRLFYLNGETFIKRHF